MLLAGYILLSVGFILAIMAIRFMMVRNSLKTGIPSDKRLKLLAKEFRTLWISGLAMVGIGIISLFFFPKGYAQVITNAGVTLLGLSLPQYLQWFYGKGSEEQVNNSIPKVEKLVWGTITIGSVCILVSGILYLQS